MSVGVTKDYKPKVRNLHSSYTLGWWIDSYSPNLIVVYYESVKRELKMRSIYECRCYEKTKTKTKYFTLLPYTTLIWQEVSLFAAEKKRREPRVTVVTLKDLFCFFSGMSGNRMDNEEHIKKNEFCEGNKSSPLLVSWQLADSAFPAGGLNHSWVTICRLLACVCAYQRMRAVRTRIAIWRRKI